MVPAAPKIAVFPISMSVASITRGVSPSTRLLNYRKMIQTLFGSVEQEPSLLEKLKSGVQKTRAGLVNALEDALQGRKEIDAELLDELEFTLISADIGVRTTEEILERIRERVGRHQLSDAAELKGLIREHLLEILEASERAPARVLEPPAVVLVVGVNGSGKTTTIGKLSNRFKNEQRSVLLCAADTFRAAAIEQLEIWGQRTGTQVIRQGPGSDPSAVLYDALSAARARKVDYVIVDTAGRLQTKENLMAELQKMDRTAKKVIPDAPHEVLLVLDATTGQNGLEQARKFTETSGVTGIVLTKLDGTAKGGIVVAIARELNLPIRYIGVGEKVDDLLPFDPEKFIESLFEK
jgi:fused signal recognition particle receptor